MEAKSCFVTLGGFELHYREHGPPQGELVVLSHGLARSARDCDPLAARLAARYRVVCPDMIGRGLSQWSRAPEKDYCLERYCGLSAGLIAALGAKSARWVGTSMGGTIGIRLAGSREAGTPAISHLVLNDTGPVRAPAAIERIARAIGNPPVVDTLVELEAFFRRLYAPCGERSDAAWRALTEYSMRRTDAGRYTCHYDPGIVAQFGGHPEDFDLWAWYDRIGARTLCIRGASSDLLTREVAREMTQRGPRARLVELKGLGHAPNLDTAAQLRLVEEFLAN